MAEVSLGRYDNARHSKTGRERTIHPQEYLLHLHSLTQRLWKAQTQILHSSMEAELKAISDSESAAIREMYARPDRHTAWDRHYSKHPLEF